MSPTTKRSFKRPFQPSINSYFNPPPPSPGRPPTAPQTTDPTPALPPTIQSSLLNVGMRIRKSVPEGYKTRPKTFCGSATPIWGAAAASHRSDLDSPSQLCGNASSTFPGLVPYCGILKVGGHAAQPTPHPPAENDLPPLQFGHQGSWEILSCDFDAAPSPSAAMANGPNKRRREDADEEDLGVEAEPVSPRSRPVSHTPMPNLDSVRRMAVPRSRRKVLGWEGLRETESEMVDVGDLEEAEFLRPVEWGGGI